MDWVELLRTIFEICIIPLLGTLTTYVIKLIQTKRDSIKSKTKSETLQKYIDMLADTITACVVATNQTYVEALKDKDIFDEKAQAEALDRTYKAVIEILPDEALKYLNEAYGDINTFILNKIECEVNYNH